jgi:hypothetical protein
VVLAADGKKYQVIQEVTGIAPPNIMYFALADTLRDVISTYEKEMQITSAVLNQAEADAPRSGYDTSKYYTLQRTDDGTAELVTVDNDTFPTYDQYQDMIPDPVTGIIPAQATDENGVPQFDTDGNPIFVGLTASTMLMPADGDGYGGYLTQDGKPPNGAPFTAGISFPTNPINGQFALRTDYLPNRLFRFDGARWRKFEDNVRMTMSNLGASDVATGTFAGKDVRQTQKATFINNPTVSTIDGHVVKQKQGLSKALRPEADE